MVGGIVRIRIGHGVTRRDEHGEQRRQPVDRAFHGEQLRLPIQVDAVRVAIPVLGRLKEARLAVERRIARVRGIVNGALGHIADEIRRERVGIAFRQVDHVGTAGDRRGHLTVHLGEHVRRNRLRDGGE